MAARSEETKGIMYGLAAYIGWGFAPLYWPLLQPSSPYEVLAHRIIWSLVFLVLVNAAMGTWRPVMAALRDARKRRLLIVAAALITVNWGLYIWSVNNDHVVDASLGYFITPFISVVLGTTVLGERLRNAQKIAIAIAAISVIVLTFNGGQLPWIGLVLAASFGAYGYVKKLADVEARSRAEDCDRNRRDLGDRAHVQWRPTAVDRARARCIVRRVRVCEEARRC